jgi:hypothetical protein
LKKIFISIFTFVLLTGIAKAQDFVVPSNYKFNNEDDYTKQEPDVLKCINWLLNSPVNKETDKRMEAYGFFFLWMLGNPKFDLEINESIVNFTEPNKDLLMIFYAGWAKHVIVTKDYQNKEKGYMAGLESVMTFYKKNKNSLLRDTNIENYIKMKQKGTLADFVIKKI